MHGRAVIAQQNSEHPASLLITVAILGRFFHDLWPQLADKLCPHLGVGDWILAHVKPVGQRIRVNAARVLIRGISQGRLTAAGGDLFQFVDFALGAATERFVTVFNRPQVIRADCRGEIISLVGALRREIRRAIIHHGAGQARLGRSSADRAIHPSCTACWP